MALQGIDYFMENQQEFDKLDEAQLEALARGEEVEVGDTAAAAADSEGTPAPALETAETQAQDSGAEQAGAEAKAEDPVLLARDGKHVIPYSRLEEAQQKAAQLEAALQESNALIAKLQEAKAADAETGGTAAQEAVIAEYNGEFPEVAADLKPYLQKLIDAGVETKTSELKAKLDAALAPVQKVAADKAAEEHFGSIRGVHSDFDQLVESNAVERWIKTQPSFLQASMQKVYESGTAGEVIELFTAYKDAQGIRADKTVATPSKEDFKGKAAAVIAAAKGGKPLSLSDVPSAGEVVTDEIGAESKMTASQLLAKMEQMSPDKILAHLARVA